MNCIHTKYTNIATYLTKALFPKSFFNLAQAFLAIRLLQKDSAAMDESDLERQPLCEGPHPITPRKIHCLRRHELVVVLLIALVVSAVWEMAGQKELHAQNAVESSGKMQVKYETSLGG